ncbi:unnamed protein product [Candidula unifasciata]|uniref:Uncharacterized protein n=1 Tax=Candidula unifasciata TaxID=100452 RepID=A0A8S3ZUH1_9EUPU|nr:unnamed protein product [Candidula unifasciata]
MANQTTMERDLLSCSICLDLLKDPKTLPCMHRFCQSCLNGHIVASTARTSPSRPGFSCPVCRESIKAPDGSSKPSTWAGLFKTDFMVKSMVEVYQSKQVADAPKGNHPCPKHMDKEQELYCFDCSTTVCHLCAVISHRACRKIGTVTEAAQQRRATWQGYLKKIPHLINKALETDKLKESYMKEINKNKVSVENKIKETAKNICKIVTDEENKLLKQVQGNYDNLQQTAVTFNEQIQHLMSSVTEISTKLSSSSDFDLMVEKDISKTVESFSKHNQTVNKDYRGFCEALPSVKWSFQEQTMLRVNLGTLQFTCSAAVPNLCTFPGPQMRPSYGWATGRFPSQRQLYSSEQCSMENAFSNTHLNNSRSLLGISMRFNTAETEADTDSDSYSHNWNSPMASEDEDLYD